MKCFNHFFAFFFGRFVDCCYLCGQIIHTNATIMLKTFKIPSVKIVYLEEADIIATSTKEMGINSEEDVDYVDKAPNRSIWGDD